MATSQRGFAGIIHHSLMSADGVGLANDVTAVR